MLLCFQNLPRPTTVNHFINNALWVGFYKTDNISDDIKVRRYFSYVLIILILLLPFKSERQRHGAMST